MIDNDKRGIKYEGKRHSKRNKPDCRRCNWKRPNLKQGSIFVLGLSSSEVIGGQIGKESSQEIGEIIVKTILDILEEKGIHLAVQGCEHVNRALVVERQVAEQFGLEIVSVLPTLHAGGSGQLAAFKFMKDPVEVEFINVMLDWISEILQLACMLSMFRFRFALF